MAVQLIALKCPACGADINVESGREFSFCSYCGSKIIMNNENEHIYRNIDEARIKEAENNKLLRLREMELEEQENLRGRKAYLAAYGVALLFIVVGALICIANASGAFGIMIGIYIALFTFIKSDDKKKRKRRYVGSDEVAITESMEDFYEKNYQAVVLLFKGAGFTNVTAVPLNDLNMFTMKSNGKVETVTINGSDEFGEGDIFPKDANILITYHSK